MVNLETKTRQCLREFDLHTLFIEEMGWDHHISSLEVFVDGFAYTLKAVAQKRGMVVFVCAPVDEGLIPDYPTRRKIERQVAKSVHEHLIIYTSKDNKFQVWQWVKREAGKPTQCREHRYYCNQPGDSLLQKLSAIAFSLEEEEGLTIVDVASRVRADFDVDRVTKRFYDRFKSDHDTFLKFLKGIPDEEMQRWYASVMLNRLMFIYFIQKKGFLDNNINYLLDNLAESKKHGRDRFYKDFLCPLFFEGFAKKQSERKATINQLLGKIPFLNGGIFQPHQLEQLYGKSIQIADAAFEKLFNFFDQYQWHLDERPLRADNEINPDVLGYIFEKYVNQKQMGAYYTKEDITGYISKNTIIPYLFDEARKKCKIAFEGEHSVWHLLQADPDRYIYDAVKKGVVGSIHESPLPLPSEIAAGLNDVSKRTEWNKPAPEEYGLPTEIWREVVARRKRYEEVHAKLSNGEIQDVNDLITYNLDIRQFAQDMIENCEGPELLRAIWHTIEQATILDPTCGSGAFLFAVLNILEPLYEACLERMEVFLDEMERSGEKHRPEKFSDFRKVLERIEKHPNRRYFIFKSIIVNNLYGVDIMEEAIEICKLRLFLKLVAQVDQAEKIEPLPDIDFNIRAGNTLVGYATYEEVRKGVLGDTQGKFDLGKDMQRIDEKAQDVDRLFKLFREQQTELGGEVTSADKQILRNRLKALEDELNRYLVGEYGIDIPARHSHESGNPESLDSCLRRNDKYQKWLNSHKPFHWFLEFYGTIKKGGFNVIIGNPPYVEYSKVRKEYEIKNYQTESCGNLYAYMVERSVRLLASLGRFGMIIPLSSVSTPRMSPILNFYQSEKVRLWLSFYAGDSNPSTLFTGVKNQLSIHLLCRDHFSLFTTNYIRWFEEARDDLFRIINYVNSSERFNSNRLFKIGSDAEIGILKKLKNQRKPISVSFCKGGSKKFYYRNASGSYYRFFTMNPPTIRANNKSLISTTLKLQSVSVDPEIFVVVLSRTLFHWFWTCISDNYHITSKEFEEFNLNLSQMNNNDVKLLKNLCNELMKDYMAHSRIRIEQDKRNNIERQVQIFEPRNSKPIIDKIDRVLAGHYGFTDGELDFIINYDIKYRMGRDSGEDTEDTE